MGGGVHFPLEIISIDFLRNTDIGPIGLGVSYGPLRNTSVAVKEQR